MSKISICLEELAVWCERRDKPDMQQITPIELISTKMEGTIDVMGCQSVSQIILCECEMEW